MDDGFVEGMIMGEGSAVQQLMDEGVLLPEYDWQDEKLKAELEEITADWFRRHPEVIRGSGEFQRLYPEKVELLDMLRRMSEKRRITPKEYQLLHQEIFNF